MATAMDILMWKGRKCSGVPPQTETTRLPVAARRRNMSISQELAILNPQSEQPGPNHNFRFLLLPVPPPSSYTLLHVDEMRQNHVLNGHTDFIFHPLCVCFHCCFSCVHRVPCLLLRALSSPVHTSCTRTTGPRCPHSSAV